MRRWHFVSGVLFLVPAVGCQDKRATQSVAEASGARALAEAAGGPALAAAASARAMASALAAQAQTGIGGKVHSAGGELGTWDIALSDCQSGESKGFYGVDLYVAGSDDLRLRYVHDEAMGEVVKVAVPSKPGAVIVFDRNAKCSVLEGAIEKTNFTTWTPKGKIRHVNGHVKFDCTHTGGKGRVTGEATFTHCH